jgi:tetratricopeptide (TPR) repeat protein
MLRLTRTGSKALRAWTSCKLPEINTKQVCCALLSHGTEGTRATAPTLWHACSSPLQPSFAARTMTTATNGDDDDDGNEGERNIADAFEDLINAAFQLVEQGRPIDAEYILTQGAKQFEEAYKEHAIITAPLWDQAALIAFMHDRAEPARDSAKRAYDLLQECYLDQPEPEAQGAAAAAATRYGCVLLASGGRDEALPLLSSAAATLSEVVQAVDGGELGDKFATALGEARFYEALAELAGHSLEELTVAGVERMTPRFREGVDLMTKHLGDHPLIACALREHHKAIPAALDSEKFDVAAALLAQQVELQRRVNPDSEHVAMLLYQQGTLQYVVGDYAAAAQGLERALALVSDFEGGEEHSVTVKHRLGMVLGALGQYDKARSELHEAAPELVRLLGQDNPVSSELNLMMAYMALKQ